MNTESDIFPASAGVFPGDHLDELAAERYSPHPRGCFLGWSMKVVFIMIFPASAGVFPNCDTKGLWCVDIPRIRGGVSAQDQKKGLSGIYSPHPRGCFRATLGGPAVGRIFPASAGVFLPLAVSSR